MKMTLLKATGHMTLAIAALVALAQSPVFAQTDVGDDKSYEQEEDASSLRGRGLEGSWNLQATRLNCQTGAVIGNATAMLTFTRGGTVMDTGTQISPALRGVGHGVWRHESGGHYTAAFQFFRFNADGTLAGKQVIRQQMVLNRAGTEFTNTSSANVLDVNGNVIATNCSTAVATRFE
jgi:hypothetical protein